MMGPREAAPVHILLVDDNPDDLQRLCHCEAGGKVRRESAASTQSARAMLSQRHYDLIVVGTYVPGEPVLSLLHAIHSSLRHRSVPVIVFSRTASAEDVNNVYDAGASCLVLKPENEPEFQRVCREMFRFWLRIVCLPEREEQ